MKRDFPELRMVDAGDAKLAVYEANGDPDGTRPPVILVHGWPEIAFCWKNQIHAIADAGYRTIAFDLKGFGRSDAPNEVQLYDVEHMTRDFCGLLNALDIDQAIFCGHDWGGSLVWSMGQWRPERVAGVISICTPVKPRSPAPPVDVFKQRFGQDHYFVKFQTPDLPEKIFAGDVERFVNMMFRAPAPRDRWPMLIPDVYDLIGRFQSGKKTSRNDLIVPPEVVEIYVNAYTRSGFHGGINLYRNVDRNWALMEERNQITTAPAMWIGAELDLFLPPEFSAGMEKIVPDLETHVINGCGHWVTWERPDALNTLLVDWLNRRFSI